MRCACASPVSLQSEWYRKKGTKEEGREGGREREGHVTPSFRTDDKTESRSNFNLQVSLV